MRRTLVFGIVSLVLALGTGGNASALSWTWAADPANDAAGGSTYEIYSMGYAFEGNALHYAIRTNFPESGTWGSDSYAFTHLSPGDLRVNAAGNIFGVAFSTHANVVQQAYSGTWPTVTKGNLYTDARFATGTYEKYEQYMLAQGITPSPSDGNLYDGKNSYPTLIKNFSDELTGVSSVQWVSESDPSTPWMYEITGTIEVGALGLDFGEAFDLFWSQECGNDAAKITGVVPIPEPSTLLLLAAGTLGLGLIRRRKLAA